MMQTTEIQPLCYCQYQSTNVDTITIRGSSRKVIKKTWKKAAGNGGRFLVNFVSSCIVEINGMPIDQDQAHEFAMDMCHGDLFMLLLEIRNLVHGSSILKVKRRCDSCRKKFVENVDTASMPRKENKRKTTHVLLPVGFKVNGKVCKKIILEKPTGKTLVRMFEGGIPDFTKAAFMCLRKVDDLASLDEEDFVLCDKDRQTVETQWFEDTGGVVGNDVTVACPQCKQPVKIKIDLFKYLL